MLGHLVIRGGLLNTPIPTTQNSLLARLKDRDDVTAWAEFEAIYRPAIYRFVRRRNLQPADADDLAQQVMITVAKKIDQWDSERSGSFRAFLLTVTRNATLNHLRRRTGDSRLSDDLSVTNDPSAVMESDIDWELRRAAFRSVAAMVRHEFKASTWDSFWLVAVLGHSPHQAARELGLSLGAVYTNKSRVIKRIREQIASTDLDHDN
ncbi:MAG: sigma-70 family RNA polymerase sigma factor [Planctomycetota bacterium]